MTLDHVSGGRAILGLGAAWMETEHEAHGIDFGTGFGQRLDWLDESVAAIRGLLDGETVTSPGGRYAFRELRHPPPGAGAPPDHDRRERSHEDAPNRRQVRGHVERLRQPDELVELDGVLRDHCTAVERDERGIERRPTCGSPSATRRRPPAPPGPPDGPQPDPARDSLEPSRPLFGPPRAIAARLREYVDAGFSTVIVEVPAPYDIETLERLIGEVKPLVDADRA